jgi:hypothetical protein
MLRPRHLFMADRHVTNDEYSMQHVLDDTVWAKTCEVVLGCDTCLSAYNGREFCSLHRSDVVLRTRGRSADI